MATLKEVFCKFCQKKFFRQNGRYNEAKKFGWNQYCSKKCLAQARIQQLVLFCENCSKKFYRAPNDISPHNYCCQSCAAVVNNKKYPKNHLVPKLKSCVSCGKQFRKSKGNIRYCSFGCRKAAEFHTPEDVLDIIRKAAEKMGRIPARRELRGISSACQRLFGSWNKAVIAAGLEPNRSHSQRMYKRVNTKAKDGHLCDSISEAIIDDWLYHHKIIHTREVIYPFTNYRADWMVEIGGQKIFIEYFGLASDSPRYDRGIIRKQKLCRDSGIALIEIYPRDLYPQERLQAKFSGLDALMSGRPALHRS